MWFAQDNKRKAGTAAAFGSEMHGKLSVQARPEQTAMGDVCVCVYLRAENKCLGETTMLRKFWVMHWRNEGY